MLTICKVELVRKQEFTTAALVLDNKAFVVHVAFIASSNPVIQPSHQVQIAFMKADDTLTAIPSKYADFMVIFFSDPIVEHLEYIKINNYIIELIYSKQSSFKVIYSLGSMEWEILKKYIKINRANSFFRPFISSADALIFFDQKLDGSFYLCINYQGLNNLTIQN